MAACTRLLWLCAALGGVLGQEPDRGIVSEPRWLPPLEEMLDSDPAEGTRISDGAQGVLRAPQADWLTPTRAAPGASLVAAVAAQSPAALSRQLRPTASCSQSPAAISRWLHSISSCGAAYKRWVLRSSLVAQAP